MSEPDEARRGSTNTFEPPKITYAKIELTKPTTPAFPKIAPLWKQFRFIDITPQVDGKKVGSLQGKEVMEVGGVINKDGTIASRAQAFLKKMEKVTPDWFFISGHHARLYAADKDKYRRLTSDEVAALPSSSYGKLYVFDNRRKMMRKLKDDEQALLPDNLDKDVYVFVESAHKYSGFFNEHYHHARWAVATRTKFKRSEIMPDLRKLQRTAKPKERPVLPDDLDYELFLRTTEHAPTSMREHDDFNPLFSLSGDDARKSKCKGVILAGCNSLIDKELILPWYMRFPDSLVIGARLVLNGGYELTKALAQAPMARNRKFWENPRTYFGNDRKKVKTFAEQVAKKMRHDALKYGGWGLGLIYYGDFYTSRRDASGRKTVQCVDLISSEVVDV